MSIINRLKDNNLIRNVYFKVNKYFIAILCGVSPVIASKYLYKRTTGKKLNLKNPKDFNEKLQWLKLYWNDPLIVQCADKYEVREYVKSIGCYELLNELYAVYNNTKEIDWDKLPGSFAMKCTHGCGCNIICADKDKLDKKETLKQLNKWLKTKYGRLAAESHYDKIQPRIICEKYIGENTTLPIDYKIFCFNGKPELVLVCTDRATGYKRFFLDLNWKPLDLTNDSYSLNFIPDKPTCLENMLIYAEKLSRPFPFVRVDFYDYNGSPILGEMTFTPVGCMATYFTEASLQHLGNMVNLPLQ
jgi:hypothetical protein